MFRKVLNEFYNAMEDREYDLEEIYSFFFSKYPFKKNYLKLAIKKCIINNPHRVLLGAISDAFILKDGKYIKYTGQKDYPYYTVDMELRKQNSIKNREISEQNKKEFLNFYTEKYNSVEHFKPQQRDILIISTCTDKKLKGTHPAKELYQGDNIFWLNCVPDIFDWYILSGGYGLIPADTVISNYNHSLNSLKAYELDGLQDALYIYRDFRYLLENTSYKTVILLLSETYLRALKLHELDTKCTIVHFGLNKLKDTRLEITGDNFINIKLNQADTKYFRCSNIHLKTKVICEYLVKYKEFNLDTFNKFLQDKRTIRRS